MRYSAVFHLILVFSSCRGQSTRSTDGDDGMHAGGAGASTVGGGHTGGVLSGGTRASGGADPGGASGHGGEPGGMGGSSGGDTSVGGGAGVGEGGSSTTAGVCRNPHAWSSDLEACEGDFVHRPASGECSLPQRDEAIPNLPPNAGVEDFEEFDCEPPYLTCRLVQDDCTRDADCGGGYCLRAVSETYDEVSLDEYINIRHWCHTPCTTDSECASNELCTCSSVIQNATRAPMKVGVCEPADCRIDADCGQGALCIAPLTQTSPGSAATTLGSFHCQSPADECHGPDVCPVVDDSFCGNVAYCFHDGDHFVCSETDPDNLCLL